MNAYNRETFSSRLYQKDRRYRRKKLQELHRIKKSPSRSSSKSKDRTKQNTILNFKNIKMTSLPSLKMSELKVEYLLKKRPTKSIARI